MMPSLEMQEPPLENADWESWLTALQEPDLPVLEDPLADLDQEAMNTPDGSHRLDDLLEERDLLDEALALDGPAEPTQDVLDSRFLNRPDLHTDGVATGHTLQYMELIEDGDNRVSGRILDIAHYDDPDRASQVYDMIQTTLAEGTLAQDDLRVLASEVARTHDLSDDDWRVATPDDHARFLEQNPTLDEASRDLLTDELLGDPDFNGNLFRETAADPELAAQEQERLVNEQALASLKGIGLAVQTDFDLSRDSFYDPARNERLINGIFQQDPADATQNCRPMLIALTSPENGIGFSAQAMEFGGIGSLSEVQIEHDQVQTALETGGIEAGIAAIETLEVELAAPEISHLSLEIS